MMSNPPLQIVPSGVLSTLTATGAEEGVKLPVGEILFAMVIGPPPGQTPGTLQLNLDNGAITLIRADFPAQTGERLAFRVEGEGDSQTLQVLARSGGPGAPLVSLSPGQVRLAQNQPLTNALSQVLANAKGTVLGEVLEFRNTGSAPVRIGALTLNFQIGAAARPGDHLFIRPVEVGGTLGLNVFARGGPLSSPPPSGLAGAAQILRVGAAPNQASATEGLPAPGSIITGTLVSLSAPAAGSKEVRPTAGSLAVNSGLNSASPLNEDAGGGGIAPNSAGGKPSGQTTPPGSSGIRSGENQASPQDGRSGSVLAGASSRAPGQTALLRFPGFEAEVPWPPEAAESFPPGSSVRVLINQLTPILDLELLPPGGGNKTGGGGYIPSGEAGAAGFGVNLIALAEGLEGAVSGQAESIGEGPLRQAMEGLREVLRSVVLREGDLAAPRLQEIFQRSGALAYLSGEAAETADGIPRDLQAGLQRFLNAAREAGSPGNQLLGDMTAQAEQSLTSVEFLQTVNGLRHYLEEGTYLQIPYSLGNERGTMDIVVRRDGDENNSAGGSKENHSAVFLLELEGLGALRVDAGVQNSRVHIRFTTVDEGVGKFIEKEIPKLRSAIESQDLAIDGISWILGRAAPEPVIPTDVDEDPTGDNSFISLRV